MGVNVGLEFAVKWSTSVLKMDSGTRDKWSSLLNGELAVLSMGFRRLQI